MQVESQLFEDDGETVNNATLPLVLMRETEAAQVSDPASWFEQRFAENGWGASWRWGVYPFHHFHTNNHEVLGVASGEAELLMGGEKGVRFVVSVGDVVVIPAGVGHKCERNSSDFQVVGAYPDAIGPDLVRSGEGDVASQREAVGDVSLPQSDPVYGEKGPLMEQWGATSASS